MSAPMDPVRVVEQLDLDGRVSVVELHGIGTRARANVLYGLRPEAAARALHEPRFLGTEVVSGQANRLERPCPRCGRTGDARDVFGFRSVGWPTHPAVVVPRLSIAVIIWPPNVNTGLRGATCGAGRHVLAL